MTVLFAPAHYYISDSLGSEPSWPYYAMLALAQQGVTVHAVAGVAELKEPLPKNIHLTTLFGAKRSSNALVELGHKILFYREVAHFITEKLQNEKIDVVHHFAPISPQSANILAARGALRNIPFTMGPAMAPAAAGQDLGVVLGVKSDWRVSVTRLLLGPIGWFAYRWYRRTLNQADHLFAVTSEAVEHYATLMPRPKISLVPAGIEVGRYQYHGVAKHNPHIVLAVCYLVARKGIDVLIRAFAAISVRHKKARLWIVGNGPEEESLRLLARQLKVERMIRFWGFVDNKQVAKYYAEAGIFASPTRREPFGQTFLEAMTAGLPIVASHTGGIPDIVSAEVGFTHPVDDVGALARHLDRLLADPELQRKMGQAAKLRVREHYDWSVIMQQYQRVWQRLIKEKRGK